MANLFEKAEPTRQSTYAPSDFSLWFRKQCDETQELILSELTERQLKKNFKSRYESNARLKKLIAVNFGYYPKGA